LIEISATSEKVNRFSAECYRYGVFFYQLLVGNLYYFLVDKKDGIIVKRILRNINDDFYDEKTEMIDERESALKKLRVRKKVEEDSFLK
jgi:hypothetical protein